MVSVSELLIILVNLIIQLVFMCASFFFYGSLKLIYSVCFNFVILIDAFKAYLMMISRVSDPWLIFFLIKSKTCL